MQAVAINVGANTNEPGFRAPIWADGSFDYVPIPESEPTTEGVPTYGDLDEHLEFDIPEKVAETPVHLDPEFPEYPFCEQYTYGDEHGVKAGPLSSLSAGDYLFFYATLSTRGSVGWMPPDWGAFVIGHFRLASDPVSGERYEQFGEYERRPYRNNAHVKRDPFDARVLLHGLPAQSQLYDRATPLSRSTGGTDANWLVTDLSTDSGRGPWWRRPLRFDAESTARLVDLVSRDPGKINTPG